MAPQQHYFAVIMAGGVGSRFWPASTKKHPKQFQDLLGTGKSFLQMTFARMAKLIPPENIYILTNKRYEHLVSQQLPQLTHEQIVQEPAIRNTAPCNLLAALKIYKKNPNAVISVAPSDHFIQNEDKFCKNLSIAFEHCTKHKDLLTLGIQPTQPHTGYGYIKFQNSEHILKPVESFTEKPDLKRARHFLNDGNYLWNAGIFIWRAKDILDSFQEFLPEVFQQLNRGNAKLNSAVEDEFLAENYPKVQNISIDYGIMEKAKNVKVIPAEFNWSDIGSWGSLYEQNKKDEQENVVISGKTYLENAGGNIVKAQSDKLIAIKNLSDYIIVEENDVLLICPRKDEQKVKGIRAKISKKYGDEWI